MLREPYQKILILLGLAAAVALLFIGAPSNGEFDWSDAPRHALNGVFLKDYFAVGHLQNPTEFAYNYYAQYPALTILFYPPLFYVICAPFYALFGASQNTALLVVALHYMAFAWGSWYLFRNWLAPWQAAVAALLLIAAPEVAFWGRQVMLEIPAFAFLVWSAVFFTRYRREARPLYLYLCAALLVLAMYTKISTAFLGLAFALTLLAERRGSLLRDRHIWIVAIVAILSLVPLMLITLKFGQANVQSVTGVADSIASRKTLAGWLWYLAQFPGQLGWPLAATAAAAAVLGLIRRNSGGLAKGDLVFWLMWVICGYLFFSAIDLKEARHSIFILPPLILAAVLLIRSISPPWLSHSLLALLTVSLLVQTLVFRPVYYVKGYADAADYIARHAPKKSKVLFSGYRDGSFIFNMRSREDRRDLSVIRADKLLLSVSVRRELGVSQKDLSEAEINEKINRLGIHYLVVQPGFWDDLEVMKKFEHMLASGKFAEVARIPTPANYNAHEKELVIYKNLGEVNDNPAALELGLPIIGRTINTVR
ncbi:glycosyltransferase family 39 protein [Undibacterium sp.]|uniref:glycosyltransferase family 39 protein n=1 Tax=Undibacterium sp. TaxID=1914977 RepID=UPI002BCE5F47|nr:glycosyltransferase family 39 protein [Undibacterium sp.]HTD05640.1 glycosyltransferase family 39 protein [Undibacterium sp.]